MSSPGALGTVPKAPLCHVERIETSRFCSTWIDAETPQSLRSFGVILWTIPTRIAAFEGGTVNETGLDTSRYFGQGEKVRLRPLRLEDAEGGFATMLDSPSRQDLQLGVQLPTSLEGLRASLEKWVALQRPGSRRPAVRHDGGRVRGS
jgi:hypothetical protein